MPRQGITTPTAPPPPPHGLPGRATSRHGPVTAGGQRDAAHFRFGWLRSRAHTAVRLPVDALPRDEIGCGERDATRTKAQQMAADQTVKAAPKHGGDRTKQGDYVTLNGRRNDASYLVRRLKRDRPDIAEALAQGKYKSARAAGIVNVPSAWERAVAAVSSQSRAEKRKQSPATRRRVEGVRQPAASDECSACRSWLSQSAGASVPEMGQARRRSRTGKRRARPRNTAAWSCTSAA
jgi:hypothetical protein